MQPTRSKRSHSASITDIRSAEAGSEKEENGLAPFLLFSLNLVSDAIVLLQNNEVIFVNKAFDELAQTPKISSEVFGGQEGYDLFMSSARECLGQSQSVTRQFFIYTPTMKMKQGMFHFNPFPVNNCVCCTFQLASQTKKQYIEELQRKHNQIQLLQTFFDYSPIVMGMAQIIDNDTDTVILDANPACGTELIGKRASEVCEAQCTAQWIHFAREAQKKEQAMQFESHTARDSSEKVHQSCIIYLGDDKFAFLCQDITHRHQFEATLQENKKRLEEMVHQRTTQLQEALQVKSRFLSTISHEIRTPLAGITGELTLLSMTGLTPEQQEMVRMAEVSSELLSVIINDILDLCTLEDDSMQLVCQPFSLRKVLEESTSVILRKAVDKGLEVIIDVHPCMHDYYYGDECRIRQIAVHLLSNAVKFSHKGNVVIGARSAEVTDKIDFPEMEGNQSIKNNRCNVVIYVSDDGIGIPENAKERLFQPFGQLDNTPTRRHEGVGIGLIISKKLCALMGGTMWCESIEGVGSNFCFTIPLQQLSVVSITQQPSCIPSFDTSFECCQKATQKQPGRIMIITNNIRMSEALTAKFRHWGFDFTLLPKCETVTTLLNEVSNDGGDAGDHYGGTEYNKSQIRIILVDATESMSSIQLLKQAVQKAQIAEISSRLTLLWSFHISCQIVIMSYPRQMRFIGGFSTIKKPVADSALFSLVMKVFNAKQQTPLSPPPNIVVDEKAAEKEQVRPTLVDDQPQGDCFQSILIAEDNKTSQKIIKRMLERLGYTNIDIAENGKVAVEIVNSKKVNLILMDCMMPEMDGIEATKHIRSKADMGGQPVIVALTADTFEQNKRQCLLAGMQEVLTKPVKIDLLEDVLKKYLIQRFQEGQDVVTQRPRPPQPIS